MQESLLESPLGLIHSSRSALRTLWPRSPFLWKLKTKTVYTVISHSNQAKHSIINYRHNMYYGHYSLNLFELAQVT
jgi:hypothetical protein